ncbi:MAG: 4Fe-4S dicluster domain-containing protein [Coriobacteriia bacterium]|nr:4Fe-4S dicluster domain-containing protein [Coriobacteriia bacterium]
MADVKDMAILYDTSKCTACKGCQVACKQWNQLPSPLKDSAYEFSGSYENPSELGPATWLRMTFNEVEPDDGGVQWNFGRQGCLHCTDATCETVCPVGAIRRASTGALALDREKCIGCRYCVNSCPAGVPHWDAVANKTSKCRMCEDRVVNGLQPACVSTCPTGALSFGRRDEMVSAARERLTGLHGGGHTKAEVFGIDELGGTHVLTVAHRGAEAHGLTPGMQAPSAVSLWQLLKPLAAIGTAAVAGVFGLSFLTGIGYRRDELTLEDREKEVG